MNLCPSQKVVKAVLDHFWVARYPWPAWELARDRLAAFFTAQHPEWAPGEVRRQVATSAKTGLTSSGRKKVPFSLAKSMVEPAAQQRFLKDFSWYSPVLADAFSDTRIDAECERLYPGRRSGVVRIDLADGRSFEKRVLDPKGEGENPMTDDDLRRKFVVNCEAIAGKAKCERLLDLVWRFDRAEIAAGLYDW